MVFKWRDNHTDQFLTLYKSYKFLWDFNNPLYKNRQEREAAYRKIIALMNVPDLTVGDVKNKIKTIRTNYKYELNKVLRSERNETAEVYVPHLLWFKKADEFLRSISVNKATRSSLSSDCLEEDTLLSFTNTEDNTGQESEFEVSDIKIEDTQIQEDNTNFDTKIKSQKPSTMSIPRTEPETPSSATILSSVSSTSSTVNEPKTVLTLPPDITISRNDACSPRRFSFRSMPPKPLIPAESQKSRITLRSAPIPRARIAIRKREAHFIALENSVNKLQKTIDLRKEFDDDEFDLFGKSIALQLKRMPLDRALICQANLQRVMIQERLEQNKPSS